MGWEPYAAPLTATCSEPISRGWLRNDWHDLAFLHWSYDPDDVQALLPEGLIVDTFDGRAWVSLVPFQMRRAGPTWMPPIPYVSNFWETNVRTYVIDARGHRAVWFLSLDCARLPIVLFAKLVIGFPYHWSKMSVDIEGARRRFTTRHRRWPRMPPAETLATIDVGDEIEPTQLDLFLTARWGTVAKSFGTLRYHPVDHQPWTLHDASVVELADSALTAPGLPTPTGDPVVRWAQPVNARFGRPVTV